MPAATISTTKALSLIQSATRAASSAPTAAPTMLVAPKSSPAAPQHPPGPMVGHQPAEGAEQDDHQAGGGGLVDVHAEQAHQHRHGQDAAAAAEQPQGAAQEEADGGGEQDCGHQSV